jgi:hypothetical protein
LKREGLLGGSFLDETEVEKQLNDYGRSGWELTSVIEVQDGIIAFFKQPLGLGFSSRPPETAIDEDNGDKVIEEPYEADGFFEAGDEYQVQEQNLPEAARHEEQNDYPEELEVDDHDVDDRLISENAEEERGLVDDDRDSFEDQVNDDELDEHADQKGIGAIRIE